MPVVLFAADSAAQRRKGFRELAEAVEGISGIDNVTLVSVGGGKAELKGGHRHVHIGRLSDDRLLAMAYSAADVFVIPSLQESFGQTVIESMACGTPVVGFASGGIPDMVRPGHTGHLAPTGDTAALRDAIVKLLRDPAGSVANVATLPPDRAGGVFARRAGRANTSGCTSRCSHSDPHLPPRPGIPSNPRLMLSRTRRADSVNPRFRDVVARGRRFYPVRCGAGPMRWPRVGCGPRSPGKDTFARPAGLPASAGGFERTTHAPGSDVGHTNAQSRMGDPLISVLMPVYNCEAYLAEAVRSVLRRRCATSNS